MSDHFIEDISSLNDTEMGKGLALEREAQQFHSRGEIDKAFASYDKAANLYREMGEHLKAAMCYAAAATCWNIHTGWQPLQNAASRSQYAAQEALAAGHFDYACSLFRDAALLYEKEGDFENYAVCYISSKRADRRRNLELAFTPSQATEDAGPSSISLGKRFSLFRKAFLNFCSDAIWGYGEKPFRMMRMIMLIVLLCAAAYAFSDHKILANGIVKSISFPEGLYFSVVTFATVGYGDYLPLGWIRAVAVFEALSGIILMPLFLVALTRRYLRMPR
jgi:tetratricopeptide (TPR) repeat protein